MSRRRAAVTLLCITRQYLVRADFNGAPKPELIEHWQEPRPDVDDLASLVEAAIGLGPKLGRKVWVLCDELWAQVLSLPAATTSRLGGDELNRALAFEVEPISGISALESVVGAVEFSATREERSHWLVQLPTADRDQLDEAIRRAGSQLGGVTHPCGLPRPLAGGDSAWERVELWNNLVACLHGDRGQPVQLHLINADPEQGRWKVEEQRWRESLGKVERREVLLTTGELLTYTDRGEPLETLPASKLLPAWLTAWAEALVTEPERLPLVRPAARPMAGRTRALIAAGMGLAAVILCTLFHVAYYLLWVAPAQAELARLEPAGRQLDALNQQFPQLDKQKKQLAADNDKLRETNALVRLQRQRLARLLDALAANQPEHLCVQKIDGEPGQPVIRGVCLQEQSANELATRLARALPAEWQVQPPRLKAMDKLSGRGPWTFELHVRIVSPPSAAPATPPVYQGGD